MEVQYKKMTIVISLICLLLFLGAGIKVLASKNKTQLADEPIRALNVVIGSDQRDDLFKQLKLFSEKHAFAIRIAPTTPDDDHFISQMWREDIKLVMVNPFEEGNYRIYFYKNNIDDVPEDVLDLLVSELKSFLFDIPNVVVTEREKAKGSTN